MIDLDVLAEQFETHRPRLRGVAYRMLGSLAEADDAVQEAWLRSSRAGVGGVENLGGWLTTVVARICLNVLRSRTAHGELPLGAHVPDPVVDRVDAVDPEHAALLNDSVGLALLVVLDTLAPAERLAFVLGDPAFYQRFGFSLEMAQAFESSYTGQHFMALKLADDAPERGRIRYPAAFDGLG